MRHDSPGRIRGRSKVLVADRAALFPIVCALLRQANTIFDGIGLCVCKGFIVCWESAVMRGENMAKWYG